MGLQVKRIVEGETILYVPDLEAYPQADGVKGPWSAPVFYNPRAALTRDVSVALVNVLGGSPKVLDAMCGVGARGLRLAVESSASEVVLNDVNPEALSLAYQAMIENGVSSKVRIESVGSNTLCAAYEYREGFEYVDIDPFGSAAPFVASSLLAVKRGGVLGVCSTDAANLCGNRPWALYRLYFASNHYKLGVKETGLRILVGYVVRVAASMGLAAKPLMCYQYADYFRCHFQIERSATEAERLLRGVGYMHECVDGWKYTKEPCCTVCSGAKITGPLWVQGLTTKSFVEASLKNLEKVHSTTARTALKVVLNVMEEDDVFIPYVSLHRLVRGRGISPPSVERTILRLQELGYRAHKTHFDSKGVKTDAPTSVILDVSRELDGRTA